MAKTSAEEVSTQAVSPVSILRTGDAAPATVWAGGAGASCAIATDPVRATMVPSIMTTMVRPATPSLPWCLLLQSLFGIRSSLRSDGGNWLCERLDTFWMGELK